MNDILVPTSPGELIDKLTILRLKMEHIMDAEKRAHVRHEQTTLSKIAQEVLPNDAALAALWDELYKINGALWIIEDDIRACEGRADFGDTFITLARSVYQANDERAAIKRQINLLLGSAIIEEKSYYNPNTAS